MKLEVGKAYRTRDGKIVHWKGKGKTFTIDGMYIYPIDGRPLFSNTEYDLISELGEPKPDGDTISTPKKKSQGKISEPVVDIPFAPEVKTLRDELAMAALNGIISSESPGYQGISKEENCKHAYEYADAMMIARGTK